MPAQAQTLPLQAYTSFLREARGYVDQIQKHTKEAQQARLRLMLLLLETKSRPVLWQHMYATWEELLRAERFCGTSTFGKFEQGYRLLGEQSVIRLGVSTTLAVANVQPQVRKQVIQDIKQWLTINSTATPQEATSRVRSMAKRLDTTKVSRNRLLAYVRVLQDRLRANGIRIPPMPPIG